MKNDSNGPLLDSSEVEAVNLFCNARVRELVFGEHASVFTGTTGFNFSGIRDFEPGDPQIKVDWAHSTTTLFNPLQVRECIEERSIDIVIAADISCSARCGAAGALIGKAIARAIATIGLSASIFQDTVGLVLFGGGEVVVEPRRGGRNHVEQMIDLYQAALSGPAAPERERLAEVLAGELRRTSLIIVASDFLFPNALPVLKEIAELKHPHDLFLVMADSAFAYELPSLSAGWFRCLDSETGAPIDLTRGQLRNLPGLVRDHQDALANYAEAQDLEVLRVSPDADQFQAAIVDFFVQRRIQRR